MVIVSCSTKFHSYYLAEQLNRFGMLEHFYTVYHSKRNKIISRLNARVDNENIDLNKVITFPFLAPFYRLPISPFFPNELFDRLVAYKIQQQEYFRVFIGWSGMSLNSIKKVKNAGKIAILERGSSHIQYQNEILKDEYKKFNINFEIDSKAIEKELEEYALADYISVPSEFVKKSFIEKGAPEHKIIKNNYGSNFSFNKTNLITESHPFRILYLGSMTIRKGLIYFFEALKSLKRKDFEFWMIGSIDKDVKQIIQNYKSDNWKIIGFINHYDLPQYITECDVAVQPSIEEGLSMVIPQILKCGIPVIATVNTGGQDIIMDGVNGFIVPIRDPNAIKEKIELLMSDPYLLAQMKENAARIGTESLSWEKYGVRYRDFIESILLN